MKKISIAIFICAFANLASAAQNKASAETWGQDFRRLKDKASDALILRDSVGGSRATMHNEIDKLTQRAAKLWGESSNCYRAAYSLLNAFDETSAVMRQGGHTATSALFRSSMESGQSWANCRDDIDSSK